MIVSIDNLAKIIENVQIGYGVKGRVFDVAVDIRKGFTNLRKACVVVLTEGDYHHQFFISRGFVHGGL